MNKELSIIELYEQMFTDYVDSDFKDNNKDNLAFVAYAIWNGCYTTEQLEDELIADFCDYMNKYEKGVKLTDSEIEKLTEAYKANELDKCSEGAKDDRIFKIGDDNELDEYIEDYLKECFTAKEFIDQFWAYINWKALNEDVAENLGIQEFDGLYYDSDVF